MSIFVVILPLLYVTSCIFKCYRSDLPPANLMRRPETTGLLPPSRRPDDYYDYDYDYLYGNGDYGLYDDGKITTSKKEEESSLKTDKRHPGLNENRYGPLDQKTTKNLTPTERPRHRKRQETKKQRPIPYLNNDDQLLFDYYEDYYLSTPGDYFQAEWSDDRDLGAKINLAQSSPLDLWSNRGKTKRLDMSTTALSPATETSTTDDPWSHPGWSKHTWKQKKEN